MTRFFRPLGVLVAALIGATVLLVVDGRDGGKPRVVDLVLTQADDRETFSVAVGSTITVRLVPAGEGNTQAYGAAQAVRPGSPSRVESLARVSKTEDAIEGSSEATFRALAADDVRLVAGPPCYPNGDMEVCSAVLDWSARIVIK